MSSIAIVVVVVVVVIVVMAMAGNRTPAVPTQANPFKIQLNFDASVPEDRRQYFRTAAAFWESAVIGYQQDVDITLAIDVNILPIDGEGGLLGQAGPTSVTTSGAFTYPTTGIMQFDTDDVTLLINAGLFDEVVVHEMAHVMGFGTVWTLNNVYVDGSGEFTGAAATVEWNTDFDQAGFPAVELDGGAGTANAHWDENLNGVGLTGITDGQGRDMTDELMTGWFNIPSFLSDMTIASFQDIGYNVNMGANLTARKSRTTRSRMLRSGMRDRVIRKCSCQPGKMARITKR